jgi:hypothetical protein
MPGVGSRFRLDQQERALKLFRTLTAAGAIAAATIAPASQRVLLDFTVPGVTSMSMDLFTQSKSMSRRIQVSAPVDWAVAVWRL